MDNTFEWLLACSVEQFDIVKVMEDDGTESEHTVISARATGGAWNMAITTIDINGRAHTQQVPVNLQMKVKKMQGRIG